MRKDLLGCEYEYFEDTMGDVIHARYQALAAQGRAEGFTPLIIISNDILVDLFEELSAQEDLAAQRGKALAESAALDGAAYLRESEQRRLENYGEWNMPALGSFRPALPSRELPLCRSMRPEAEALIVKVPTRNPWEVAIWFPMGGFNECPMPVDMAAVFRRWYEQYGAVPTVLMGHDTWFLRLDRPPQSNEACETLAREHLTFCPDVSPPLGNTIREIASHLRGAITWEFWWD